MPSANTPEDNASLILVMGVTGSGKSYFINKLAGRMVVDEGHDLKSCIYHDYISGEPILTIHQRHTTSYSRTGEDWKRTSFHD